MAFRSHRRWHTLVAFITLSVLWCLGIIIDSVQAADAQLQTQPRYPPVLPLDIPPWMFLMVSLLCPIAFVALAFPVLSLIGRIPRTHRFVKRIP